MEYEWSTNATGGGGGGTNLVSMTMKLWATPSKSAQGGQVLLYTDVIMVGGNPQPIGGASRSLDDISWDLNLDTGVLSQMLNVLESTLANTSGEQYRIVDGVAIPVDGEVGFIHTLDGVEQWQALEQVQSQTTEPDVDCNGTGDGVALTVPTVTSSPNPSDVGQNVTLTATVTSAAGPPDGEVAFFDGGTLLGVVNLDGAGVATLDISFGAPGSRNITADYGGTYRFGASVSAELPHVVNALASTTTLSSSANPSSYGQPVTFTASVSPSAKMRSRLEKGVALVTFLDGNTVIGTAPLNASSEAAISTTSLGIGQHVIRAEWGGDPALEASSSATIGQSVRAPSSTTLSISPDPGVVGGGGDTDDCRDVGGGDARRNRHADGRRREPRRPARR